MVRDVRVAPKGVMRIHRYGVTIGLFILSAVLWGGVPQVAAYYLPDTGQTKCYQAVSPYAEMPCEGTGQDGAYSINLASYIDNGDGTVTDNITGLMWQKQDDGNAYNWYVASGTDNADNNNSKVNICGSLRLGGYSDWRLPNMLELLTIKTYGDFNHMFDTRFSTSNRESYWASDIFAGDSLFAWLILIGGLEPRDKSYMAYVLCVRGSQTESSDYLIDNGNGTVLDKHTSLIWQKGETAIQTSLSDAISYCESLDLGGSADWRLPNIKELGSLVDNSRIAPSINSVIEIQYIRI